MSCAFCPAAEPSLVLSPDCKHLAVKEPCSRRICLLSAQDGFKEVLATLEPLPVSRDGDVVADTVLSCSWSADSKLLLVACKSSAVYLFDRYVTPPAHLLQHKRSRTTAVWTRTTIIRAMRQGYCQRAWLQPEQRRAHPPCCASNFACLNTAALCLR